MRYNKLKRKKIPNLSSAHVQRKGNIFQIVVFHLEQRERTIEKLASLYAE